MGQAYLERVRSLVKPLVAQAEHAPTPDARYVLTSLHQHLFSQIAYEYSRGERIFFLAGVPGFGRNTFLRTLAHTAGREMIRASGASLEDIFFGTDDHGGYDRSGLNASGANTLLAKGMERGDALCVLTDARTSEGGRGDQFLRDLRSGQVKHPRSGVLTKLDPDALLVLVVEQAPASGVIPVLAHSHLALTTPDLEAIVERALQMESVSPVDAVGAEAVRFWQFLNSGSETINLNLADLLQFARTRSALGLEAALRSLAHRHDHAYLLRGEGTALSQLWEDALGTPPLRALDASGALLSDALLPEIALTVGADIGAILQDTEVREDMLSYLYSALHLRRGLLLDEFQLLIQPELPPLQYELSLRGVIIGTGEMLSTTTKHTSTPDHEARIPGSAEADVHTGVRRVDNLADVRQHLLELLNANAHLLLSLSMTQRIAHTLAAHDPYLHNLLLAPAEGLTLPALYRVFYEMLKSGTSLRDLRTIAEAVIEMGAINPDPRALARHAERALVITLGEARLRDYPPRRGGAGFEKTDSQEVRERKQRI